MWSGYTAFFTFLLWMLCAGTISHKCCTPVSAWLSRHLEKEGFHRDLVTSVQVAWSPTLTGCRLLLYERLPAGVYVDPYQLARHHGNQHRVLGSVDIEAMAHDSGWLDVLSWVDVNITEREKLDQVRVVVSLPLHARYHRADETERIASIYIESPRLFLGCDWENRPASAGDSDAAANSGAGDGCRCAERELLPCLAAGEELCEYLPVRADNSPAAVLAAPLGDLRDLELVLVGTAVAVAAGTVLLLLVISNWRPQTTARC